MAVIMSKTFTNAVKSIPMKASSSLAINVAKSSLGKAILLLFVSQTLLSTIDNRDLLNLEGSLHDIPGRDTCLPDS